MSENIRVTEAAGVVGSATLLSRLFGFIRDAVVAWYFGTGLSSDAFFVAFRIPNLLRRLFGEGSLSISFVPVFTEYLSSRGKSEAFDLARSAIRILSILLVIAALAGVLLAPLVVRLIAPGFSGAHDKFQLTVALTRIMFPYIFFIGLVALAMGILNVLGHFAAPALAPVFLNIAMIGSVFLISPHMDDPITGLAIGVLIGGVLQLALQLPFLVRKGFFFWQKAKIYHPGLKKIGKLMLPAIFGAAVYQVNIFVGTLLATLLPEGSVSYLYYADRLVQFPLGIFAIATATAVLPSLSRQAAAKDFASLRETFIHALNLVFFITLPAMAGLIALREPIVTLLFRRGAFNIESTHLTAKALLYYSMGLWAFAAVRIVVSTFYSLQDTKTPVQTAAISVAANIVLGIVLMKTRLAHGGLALATSLASMLNLVLLVRVLNERLGSLEWRKITKSTVKAVTCSLIMGVVVRGLSIYIIPVEGGRFFGLLLGISVSIGIGTLLYGTFSFILKSTELEHIMSVIFGQGRGSDDSIRQVKNNP